jgi:hypothetical protein
MILAIAKYISVSGTNIFAHLLKILYLCRKYHT